MCNEVTNDLLSVALLCSADAVNLVLHEDTEVLKG